MGNVLLDDNLEFLDMVAHELRLPMSFIKGTIQALKSYDYTKEELEQQYWRVEHSIQRAIDTLDSMTKIANNKTNVTQLSIIDVRTIVREIHTEFQDLLASRLQKMVVHTNVVPHVYGDKTMVYLILKNLIENASKYSLEKNSIKVNILQKNNEVQVRVRDYGIGVRQTELDRVFQKYGKFKRPVSSHADSTGLGLFLSNHMANLMGARISLESQKDGSIFTLHIPVLGQLRLFDA